MAGAEATPGLREDLVAIGRPWLRPGADMTDLSAFSDAGFDPKQFINQACAAKTSDEPLER